MFEITNDQLSRLRTKTKFLLLSSLVGTLKYIPHIKDAKIFADVWTTILKNLYKAHNVGSNDTS